MFTRVHISCTFVCILWYVTTPEIQFWGCCTLHTLTWQPVSWVELLVSISLMAAASSHWASSWSIWGCWERVALASDSYMSEHISIVCACLCKHTMWYTECPTMSIHIFIVGCKIIITTSWLKKYLPHPLPMGAGWPCISQGPKLAVLTSCRKIATVSRRAKCLKLKNKAQS